jgi:WhiB family transcriptional regulator, redox-sensing transcriptional regulator
VELMTTTRDAIKWQELALCSRTGKTLKELDHVFFPDSETAARAKWAAEQFCNRCPVRAACLTYAIDAAPYGLFAGTTPEQRRALGRKRERVKCPACGQWDPVTVVGVAQGVTVVSQVCRSCGASWVHSTTTVAETEGQQLDAAAAHLDEVREMAP